MKIHNNIEAVAALPAHTRFINLEFDGVLDFSILLRFTRLRVLYLSGMKLINIPKNLSDLQNLSDVRLNNLSDIALLWPKLGWLPKLQYLHVTHCNLTYLTAAEGDFKKLNSLNLSNNKFKEFPAFILRLACLRTLFISDNPQLREIPAELFMLPDFVCAYAINTKVDWTKTVFRLPNMRANQSIMFIQWQSLYGIESGGHSLQFTWTNAQNKRKNFGLTVPTYPKYLRKPSLELYKDLPANIPQDDKYQIMRFYCSKRRQQDSISRNNIINLAHIQSNINAVMACQKWLADQAKPLEVGQHVALLGDVEDDEAHILYRCEMLGLVPSRQILPETEAVVIGRGLSFEQISALQHREYLPLAAVQTLRDFINAHHNFHYKDDCDTAQRNALCELLFSRDRDAVKLGLAMLMEGGVYDKFMLADIWFLAERYFDRDPELYDSFSNVLNHFAPPHWATVEFPRGESVSKADWLKLKKQDWLEPEAILHHLDQQGIRYLKACLATLPTAAAKTFLHEYGMDYSYLYFEDLPSPRWLKYAQDVEYLYLSGRKYAKKVPKAIFKLKSLRHLELKNCGLKYIPAQIQRFQNLEELSIPGNAIKTFPKFLNHMPNLKEIYISTSPLINKHSKHALLNRRPEDWHPDIPNVDWNIWTFHVFSGFKRKIST